MNAKSLRNLYRLSLAALFCFLNAVTVLGTMRENVSHMPRPIQCRRDCKLVLVSILMIEIFAAGVMLSTHGVGWQSSDVWEAVMALPLDIDAAYLHPGIGSPRDGFVPGRYHHGQTMTAGSLGIVYGENDIQPSSFGKHEQTTIKPCADTSLGPAGCIHWDVVIAGAGLSGAVLADMYARFDGKRVLVMDSREHIGGNCYDYVDFQSGILMNKYGAHLFHTNIERVWAYVKRFGNWVPYEHRVVGRVDDKFVPIPVNAASVSLLVNTSVDSPEKLRSWLRRERAKSSVNIEGKVNEIDSTPYNGEEVAISRVGETLYSKIFKEYTMKQWGRSPKDLEGSVLARIPVSENWDSRYFPNDKYQALPQRGYTKWFEQVFDHPNISVLTSTNYSHVHRHIECAPGCKTFFTGRIDQFFQERGANLSSLPYRSIIFESTTLPNWGVAQPSSVLNYPQLQDGNFTRIVEYKHFYRQSSPYTILVKEVSSDTGDPYYPVPTAENRALFEKYRLLAEEEERTKGFHFVGRLANYKYFDMDDAIDNALQQYERLGGEGNVQKMLVGSSAIPSQSKAMEVHIVTSVQSGNLLWLKKLCACSCLKRDDVKTTLFVYVKNKDRSTEAVKKRLLANLYMSGCNMDGVQERANDVHGSQGNMHVDVRRAYDVGKDSYTYLNHMFLSHSSYADVNVFLQQDSTSGVPAACCAIRRMYEELYRARETRESDAKLKNAEVHKIDRIHAKVIRYRKDLLACVSEMIKAERQTIGLNLALPLEEAEMKTGSGESLGMERMKKDEQQEGQEGGQRGERRGWSLEGGGEDGGKGIGGGDRARLGGSGEGGQILGDQLGRGSKNYMGEGPRSGDGVSEQLHFAPLSRVWDYVLHEGLSPQTKLTIEAYGALLGILPNGSEHTTLQEPEFAVTEVLLRRVMQKHRTAMWSMLQDLSKRGDPELVAVDHIWYALFVQEP